MSHIPEPSEEIIRTFECEECGKEITLLGRYDIEAWYGVCENCEDINNEVNYDR